EMDTVIMLSKAESEDDAPEMSAAFRLEFTKARMKTPANYRQFASKTVRSTEFGFVAEEGVKAPNTKEASKGEKNRRAFRDAYANLADGVTPSPGFDGAPVRKVKADAIRDEMRSRGFLQTDDKGNLTATGRSDFHRAKTDLLTAKRFAESEGLLWRTD
ncbi:MAG TPA: hypothetical protein VIF39_14565, partial [Hyphomicrobium sp.]